jgi:REP element-mobilizing transposase RayT
LEYGGAIYHVMNRGDRQEDIVRDDTDRERFVETLGEACRKAEWQVHAYCLMRNHFHLVVETPRPNLCAGMQWLLGTYTARFNRRHRLFGHLFSGRYKSLLVDGSGDGYLRSVCDYVHLNPARARLLDTEQALRQYRWSSYPQYLQPPRRRVAWLRVDRLLGEWDIRQDGTSGRRQFERGMEQRARQEQELENKDWRELRRGWCWGAPSFRERLLAMIGERPAEHHYGDEIRESAAQQAERLVQRQLAAAHWTTIQLKQRRKGDPLKVRIAQQLRQETTVGWKWIAERLHMGHWRSAANAVRSAR